MQVGSCAQAALQALNVLNSEARAPKALGAFSRADNTVDASGVLEEPDVVTSQPSEQMGFLLDQLKDLLSCQPLCKKREVLSFDRAAGEVATRAREKLKPVGKDTGRAKDILFDEPIVALLAEAHGGVEPSRLCEHVSLRNIHSLIVSKKVVG